MLLARWQSISAVVLLLACGGYSHAQVSGSFTLDKNSYAVGEPLMFTLEFKNTGSETVYLFPKVPGECTESFAFSMNGPGSLCEVPWDTPCEEPLELKPGDTYPEGWPLDFWYRIDKPGTYKTSISLHTRYSTAHSGVQSLQVSSDLELQVVPGDPADVERELANWKTQLNDSDFSKRHDALDVLSTVAPIYFHDEIFRLARDEDAFNVEHAVGGLERLNTPEARALLMEVITSRKITNDSEESARCHAIEALGLSGDTSYFALLLPYVEHTSTCESESATLAVARLGKAAAVPSLRSLMTSQDAKGRLHAVAALRNASSPEAVDALIDALRDQDKQVRDKAAANLIELTGHSVTKPNRPAPSGLQLENLWRAWWYKHRSDTKLAPPYEVLCRM
jgi:HEAT repeats